MHFLFLYNTGTSLSVPLTITYVMYNCNINVTINNVLFVVFLTKYTFYCKVSEFQHEWIVISLYIL